MSKRFISVAILVMLVIGAGFQAVSTYAQSTGPDLPSAGSLTSTYRIVNANPTAPAVLPEVDGVLSTKLITPIDYTLKPVSGYDSVVGAAAPGAAHTVSLVQAANTGIAVGSPLSFNFVAQDDYTFALLPDMSWVSFMDSKVLPPTGMFSVRFINLSPASTLSLSVNGSVPSGLGNVAYKGASAYVNMAVGTMPVAVMSGTTTVASLKNPYNFQAFHVYTLFALGNSGSVKVVVGTDANFTTLLTTLTPGAPTGTPQATATPPIILNPIKFFLPMISDH